MCQGLPEVGKCIFASFSRYLHFGAFTVAIFGFIFLPNNENNPKMKLKMS